MAIPLEICVDDLDDAHAAAEAGADRIELCAALELGGLTPSQGMIRAAGGVPVPVFVMIRPRPGDYVFGETAVDTMLHDIETCRDAGVRGVVLGASHTDGTLDVAVLQRLSRAAEGLGRTLHRAFDVTPDPRAALEQAVQLGFDRILTSGQREGAVEGAGLLRELGERARGRIRIMAGAGIGPENIDTLLREAAPDEVHASCKTAVDVDPPWGALRRFRTDPDRVRALAQRLRAGALIPRD